MKNQKGFSLIELLIVVVIIGIIAAIAIPNLLASRRAANEGSAVSTMRTLHGAASTWFATKGKNKLYAADAAALEDQQLIDSSLAKAFLATPEPKSGYNFTYGATTSTDGQPGYASTATPSSVGTVTATGTRLFKADESGVIQEADVATPTVFTPIG